MLQIRRNVFETNSSSTHSLTICTEEEYESWKRGEVYWSRWSEEFVSKEEVEEDFKKSKKRNPDAYETLDDYLYDEGLYGFDRYDSDIDMEIYEKHYQTKSGDKIVAFGYYGYDG